METDKSRLIHLLGLQPRMKALDHALVKTYTRPSYPGSAEAERDEVHRMSEIILIHLTSGVRVGCLVEEDYFGENVEYVIMSNFHILTRDGKTLQVVDLDMNGREATIAEGKIPFADVSKEPE